jgi:3-carboxy-cis,cis-muconate cycloisomerase
MLERLFVPEGFLEATSDAAWLAAMLDGERALAIASARAGVIPSDAAEAIAEACRPDRFDVERVLVEGRASGNPAEPLARALTEAVEGDAAAYVHRGATSQDVVDTAAMLVARRALELLAEALDGVEDRCAALAEEHRSTPMVGRTLLQQAVPTTFGLKAAGWLVAVREAAEALDRVRRTRLAVQLGGAAGTLAGFGDSGLEVRRFFAVELGLEEPTLAWHADRGRIAELAGALATVAAALAKIAVDIALLAQTEVGEVTDGGSGGSSTMPHKRNPVGSALAVACARQVHGYVSVLTAPGAAEHERGVGGWQSEWHALSGALAYAGGAADAVRRTLAGLEVHPERMLENLRAAGGEVTAERVSLALADRIGRSAAHELVGEAVVRARAGDRPLSEELAADERVHLSREELAAALEPTAYLGSAEALVDAALGSHRA